MPTLRTWSGPVAAVVLAVLTGVAAAPHAFAGIDEVDQKLESVERALEQERAQGERLESSAAALAREVAGLRADLIEAAHASQNYEEHVTALEVRLARLAREDADKSETLRRRRATLAATLGALQRLSRQPPEALIAAPAAIDDTIRASLLLGAVVPLLDDEARRLRAELDELTRVRREIATERLELAAATDRLAAERRRLATLHARKLALQRETLAKHRRAGRAAARLAAAAKDLRELLQKLTVAPPPAAEKPAPAAATDGASTSVVALAPPPQPAAARPGRSFSAARGSLPMPARGRVVGRFGEATESGRSKGITIETRADAQVVTPYDGEVVFAGPFRGYGQLLIIQHGEGYHTLLAGFSRIDSVLGQWLLAGEPVGVMGRGSNGNPALYVELRRNGDAINPLPWLAASDRKVSG